MDHISTKNVKNKCNFVLRQLLKSKKLPKQYIQRGASDHLANFSVLSNPADAQNVSCLGPCVRDIFPKSYIGPT